MNEVEARLIGLAITEPDYTIPQTKSVGMVWSDLESKDHRELWQELEAMWDAGTAIDSTTVKARAGKDGYVDDLVKLEGPVDAQTYAKLIVERALERDQRKLGERIPALIKKQSCGELLAEIQGEVDRLSARYARAMTPHIGNPADELDQVDGWSTTTGLYFLDRLVRLTSSGLHFLAGDPGSGKTTIVTHMLSHNAMSGIPSIAILAEGDPLDIKLAMLTQTQRLSARFASRIRYDPTFRSTERIQQVRELWQEEFEGLPLQIHRVSDGPDSVISLVNSITKPSFICIDHAFAVISQSQIRADGREHQSFMRFFAAIESAANRNNHVVVMANQYTKAGREGEERGPDAQYGGSGIQNIATSMIHLMQPRAEISAAVGYRKMRFTIPKVRAMLVADSHGIPIDPVQVTADVPGHFYLNTKYRLAESSLPIADDRQS